MQCAAKPQRYRIGCQVTRPARHKLRQRPSAAQLVQQGLDDVGREARVELPAPVSLALEASSSFGEAMGARGRSGKFARDLAPECLVPTQFFDLLQ